MDADQIKDARAALNALTAQIDAAVKDNLMKQPFAAVVREARVLGIDLNTLELPEPEPGVIRSIKEMVVDAIISRLEAIADEQMEGTSGRDT